MTDVAYALIQTFLNVSDDDQDILDLREFFLNGILTKSEFEALSEEEREKVINTAKEKSLERTRKAVEEVNNRMRDLGKEMGIEESVVEESIKLAREAYNLTEEDLA